MIFFGVCRASDEVRAEVPSPRVQGLAIEWGPQVTMQIIVSIRSEEPFTFTTSRGNKVTGVRCSCLDEDTVAPFKNTFDYEMTEEELPKYSTKLAGKRVVLGLTDAQMFNGRLRFKGSIVRVEAPKA